MIFIMCEFNISFKLINNFFDKNDICLDTKLDIELGLAINSITRNGIKSCNNFNYDFKYITEEIQISLLNINRIDKEYIKARLNDEIRKLSIEEQEKIIMHCYGIKDNKYNMIQFFNSKFTELNAEIYELKNKVAMIDDMRKLFENYTEITK